MNSHTRFQIDLTEKFPRLHHAPIVEAVLQINAPPLKPFQQTELKDLLSKRFEGYIVHDQMQLETGFRGSPGGNVELHHKSQWDGYRLHSKVQPAAETTGSKSVLIVDIDVSTTMAIPFDQLPRTLDEMRYIKNKVFYTYMKDAEKRFE